MLKFLFARGQVLQQRLKKNNNKFVCFGLVHCTANTGNGIALGVNLIIRNAAAPDGFEHAPFLMRPHSPPLCINYLVPEQQGCHTSHVRL